MSELRIGIIVGSTRPGRKGLEVGEWVKANARADGVEFDGYIFVTAEYNHSLPGALKNALDFASLEWHNKAAGIVSYGSMGGVRANEHLRQVLAELEIADVRQNVMLSLFTDWKNFSEFAPAELHLAELAKQVDQVTAWAGALKPLRAEDEAIAA